MNMVSVDLRPFIEWDNNPFILFDQNGKIIYLNNSAEILLGYADKKDLFKLAVDYAPQEFGHKSISMNLNYNYFTFHSISIGYENEEHIGIRFYNNPRFKTSPTGNKKSLKKSDINLLLEAAISLFRTKNSNKLSLLSDPDLPLVSVDQNRFSKLLRKVLEAFRSSLHIRIELKMILGEHLIVDGKKRPIAMLMVSANGRYADTDSDIYKIAKECNIRSTLLEHTIKLEIPLVD